MLSGLDQMKTNAPHKTPCIRINFLQMFLVQGNTHRKRGFWHVYRGLSSLRSLPLSYYRKKFESREWTCRKTIQNIFLSLCQDPTGSGDRDGGASSLIVCFTWDYASLKSCNEQRNIDRIILVRGQWSGKQLFRVFFHTKKWGGLSLQKTKLCRWTKKGSNTGAMDRKGSSVVPFHGASRSFRERIFDFATEELHQTIEW